MTHAANSLEGTKYVYVASLSDKWLDCNSLLRCLSCRHLEDGPCPARKEGFQACPLCVLRMCLS